MEELVGEGMKPGTLVDNISQEFAISANERKSNANGTKNI
jgi:hypothetical protein